MCHVQTWIATSIANFSNFSKALTEIRQIVGNESNESETFSQEIMNPFLRYFTHKGLIVSHDSN